MEEKRFVKNLLPITGGKFLNNLLAASQGTPIARMAISWEYIANGGMYKKLQQSFQDYGS